MKFLFFLSCLLIGHVALAQEDMSIGSLPPEQQMANNLPKTSAQFSEMEYTFKPVKMGAVVTHVFTVKNTGKEPLRITQVKPSCGCTATDYPREDILPGKKGEIKVRFNSSGKKGTVHKTVSVVGNFEDGIVKVLKISGEVLE